MTHKEIIQELENIIDQTDRDTLHNGIRAFIQRLGPPRPEPGTVVWWRVTADDKWHLGCDYGIVPADNVNACWNWDVNGLEYKPARILAPDDHDDEALSDVFQERIQTALDYIDAIWPRMPINSSDYHADLSNLTAMLEGNQEDEL